MGCFPCIRTARKHVQNYDDDSGTRSAEITGLNILMFVKLCSLFFCTMSL